MSETPSHPAPETQHQRWVKYGANVALMIIVAIALTVLFTFLAQKKDKRIDTTAEGVFSLKPQTLSILHNLKSPIKIVSLYSETVDAKRRDPFGRDIDALRNEAQQQAQTVYDLLNEYKKDSSKIDVQWIDFAKDPSKLDALVSEVTSKYGGEVKEYKDFFDEFNKQYAILKPLVDAEAKAADAASSEDIADMTLRQTINPALDRILSYPELLSDTKQAVERVLKQKPPDYKGAADAVHTVLDSLASDMGDIQPIFAKEQDNKAVPEALRKYLATSQPRLASIKTICDAVVDKAKKLGELKLDNLRQSLQQRDSILVMGDNDLRVLPRDKIWRSEEALRQFAKNGQVKPTFAGEQMITTAIYGLQQTKKPKIAFVRPGGAPLCEPGIPGFQQGGPLSQIADHLREYNFEVVEKDLSGQYAMQAQMQGQPVAPEPSDAEIQDALWVVVALPMNQRSGPMGPMPSPIGPKLLEHLNFGGSAFVMPFPQDDSTNNALKSWGIDLRTDAAAVHETPPPQANSSSNDPAQEYQKYPFVFDIRDYGDSPITSKLRSLDSLMYPVLVVKTHAEKGVTVTPLLPIPDAPKAPKSWGETDLPGLFQRGEPPTFDAKTDLTGPLFGGAMAEKEGKGRVVVIGASTLVFNNALGDYDPELARRHVFVPRFPGNMELFTNSIFWLTHQESMIDISPSALQVSRIADMSDATLNAWRVGLLLIGLPGAVIIAGFMMYLARRD